MPLLPSLDSTLRSSAGVPSLQMIITPHSCRYLCFSVLLSMKGASCQPCSCSCRRADGEAGTQSVQSSGSSAVVHQRRAPVVAGAARTNRQSAQAGCSSEHKGSAAAVGEKHAGSGAHL